jgi:hypothetical protein
MPPKRKFENVNTTTLEPKNKRFKKNNDPTETNYKWEQLNEPLPIDCGKHISATRLQNYMLDDPCIDWLDYHYNAVGLNENLTPTSETNENLTPTSRANDTKKRQRTNYVPSTVQTPQVQSNPLFEKGNQFEEMVVNDLINMYPNDSINFKAQYTNNDIENRRRYEETIDAMKQGKKLIFQAMLFNDSNKTFGTADILIRSDFINTVFSKEKTISDEDAVIKAPNLNGDYHYRVIDIKWTTLQLCSDGKMIRNNDRIPAYKAQLAVYNSAIGLIQGYTAPKTYIMPKGWKYDSKGTYFSGIGCFDKLPEIAYDNEFDNKMLSKTREAVEWNHRVRKDGRKWTFLPQPSVPELYPNMSQARNNTKWDPVKENIAEKIGEITSLWFVNTEGRKKAHELGIMNRFDKRLTAEILGLKNDRAIIVNKMLEMVHSDDFITPKKVMNNIGNWKSKTDLDFYVDFETIDPIYYSNTMDLYNLKNEESIIFMIGIGYEENGAWNFENYYLNKNNPQEEKIIIDKFQNFIENRINDHMLKNNMTDRPKANIYHWTNAEKNFLNMSNRRNQNKWVSWMGTINWIDLCEIFQKEPIIVKNQTNFKLKTIAKSMAKNNLIKTSWEEGGITNGLSAMEEAGKIYRSSHGEEITQKMSNIRKYNEVDCKVLYEITNYMRNNMI